MVEIELYNSVRKFKSIKSTSLLISGINVPLSLQQLFVVRCKGTAIF